MLELEVSLSILGRRPLRVLGLFVVLAVVLDLAFGMLLLSAHEACRSGATSGGVSRWALDQTEAQVVIFGSSRARHHVVPAVIERELGLRSVNVGLDGQGLRYARLMEILLIERLTGPRLFILQVDEKELFEPPTGREMVLAPLYGTSEAFDAAFTDGMPLRRLKLVSHAYRFNSLVLPLLTNLLTPRPVREGGFDALDGTMSVAPSGVSRRSTAPLREDGLALVRDFIDGARRNGIEVVLFLGPRLQSGRDPESAFDRASGALADVARSTGATFVPLGEEASPVFRDPASYSDANHLNRTGALALSTLLAKEARRALDASPAEPAPAAATSSR